MELIAGLKLLEEALGEPDPERFRSLVEHASRVIGDEIGTWPLSLPSVKKGAGSLDPRPTWKRLGRC
jgi:hypothetical protein